MPRIAIPMPHSFDPEYAERAMPQYERAVAQAGGEPVRVPLNQAPDEIMKLMERCDGVLLPGSKADVDPARFNAVRSPRAAPADPQRDAVDDFLLQYAYRWRKPVLGICYGLQSLNVYCKGSLIQHIPDFLPAETRAKINHEAGKDVAVAHTVEIEPVSKLAEILGGDSRPRMFGRAQLGGTLPKLSAPFPYIASPQENLEGHGFSSSASAAESDRTSAPRGNNLLLSVNSSHHQSAEAIGDGLRIVARCPDDGIIEALEGTAPDHFVLAVQWHPERSVDEDGASRGIFRALIGAAVKRQKLGGQLIP